MKLTVRMRLDKIAQQVNLRPAGVWDFVLRPDLGNEQGRDEAAEIERLWAMAEREAYIAGELPSHSAVAS